MNPFELRWGAAGGPLKPKSGLTGPRGSIEEHPVYLDFKALG